MKSKNVRETLLNALFVRPRPLSRGEFFDAQNSLFPCRQSFIAFLETQELQTAELNAKECLLHLCYFQPLSPPVLLLFNLLDFQQSPLLKKEGQYIAQDHFTHLVNLYLLGIYIYSYHKPLHDSVSRYLNRKLNQDLKASSVVEELQLNKFDLFSVAWLHFVLFHDLAYPIEHLPPTQWFESKTDKSLVPYIDRLGNTVRGMEKDIFLRLLAKVSEDYFTFVYDNDETKLQDHCNLSAFTPVPDSVDGISHSQVGNKTGSSKSTDKANRKRTALDSPSSLVESDSPLKRASDAEHLLHVISKSGLERVLLYLERNEIYALLTDEKNGSAIAIIHGGKIPSIFASVNSLGKFQRLKDKISTLNRSAFETCRPPVPGTRWSYFALGLREKIQSAGEKALFFRKDQLVSLFNELAKDVDFNKEVKRRGVCVGARAFSILTQLYDRTNISTATPQLDLPSIDNQVSEEYRNFKSDFASNVGELIARIIHSDADVSKAIDKIFNNPVKLSTEGLVEVIQTSIPKLKNEVDNLMIQRFTLKIQRQQAMRDALEQFVTLVSKDIPCQKKFFDADSTDLRNFQMSKLFAREDDFTKLDAHLKEKNLPKARSFVEHYLPEHAKRGGKTSFNDHGFASVLIYKSVMNRAKEIAAWTFNNTHPPVDKQFIRSVRSGMGFADEDMLSNANLLGYIENLVEPAIFLHNAYPSAIGSPKAGGSTFKDYRHKLSKDPFSFLAFFVDGLQMYDRKKLVNPALEDARILPGSDYDLVVTPDGSGIQVTFSGHPSNTKRLEKLKMDLDAYLDHASAFIATSITEK